MDEGAKRWLLKAARKNFWRVARWYDLDDLIQEGYEVYYETIKRYPDATDPPHRMAMFKLLFASRVNDLANKRTRGAAEVLAWDVSSRSDPGRLESIMDAIAAPSSAADAMPLLAHAPQHVRDAVALLTSDEGARRMRSRYRRAADGRRETLNERLCRLLGAAPGTEIVAGLLRALGVAAPPVQVREYEMDVVVVRLGRGARREVAHMRGRVALCGDA